MGIYIKGMEMPKEGSWRSIRIYPDGTIGRPIGFGDYALVEGAKAVPVPPHGMIDRTMILDAIRIELASADAVNDTEDYQSWMRVFDYVRKFPTVIEAEEGET